MPDDTALAFGSFFLWPARRRLLDGDSPVKLGSRAFDILVMLVERAGEVVPNAELMERVWPNVVVEPGALRVHITGLRKVLGDEQPGQRYFVNVPGQGYCFVGQVSRIAGTGMAERLLPSADASEAVQLVPASAASPGGPPIVVLPAQVTRVIGREGVVADLLRELPRRRCISLVGPAGMGKTTVTLAAARALALSFEHGAVFVNFALISDPGLVTITVISALGLPALASDPLAGLLAHLRERRVLLVLDNCEHVIDAAAHLADALLTGAPEVHLLMTSREPLRVHGEWVRRLESLDLPPLVGKLDVEEILRYPSVELFVERVRAALDWFEPAEADVGPLVRICRALDGIPLALELAAAGVESLGIRGVEAQLGNRLALLTRGRRTALPRQRTLRAALDWDYALLTPSERSLLRAVSVFRAHFTADSAHAVAAMGDLGATEEVLYNLVSKSLVASDTSGGTVLFCLLNTTREYWQARLDAEGEAAAVAARHANHMLELADAADTLRNARSAGEWRAQNAHLIDDIQGALQWCLSLAGALEQEVARRASHGRALLARPQHGARSDRDAWSRDVQLSQLFGQLRSADIPAAP